MLTLKNALIIADATHQKAAVQGIAPLCVTVLDTGGHVLVTLRDERASLYRTDIAFAKAMGCLGMGCGGRDVAKRANAMPALYASFAALTGGNLIPVAGGVLVRNLAGAVIGAVGVSGDTADNDELCAVAGITAAGLQADTGAAG